MRSTPGGCATDYCPAYGNRGPVALAARRGACRDVHCTLNPLNGKQYAPNSLGLLSEVVKIFTDGGRVKG